MSCDPTAVDLIPAGKDWVDYLAALLTPTIAILGSAIAYQQWKTNTKRLKHELFDRRYAQFEAVRDFLGSIMGAGKATSEAQQVFLSRTKGLRFTFNRKTSDYVHTYIWCKAIDLETLQAELEGVPVGDERSQNVRRQSEIKKHLYKELESLEERFAKYLELQH